MARILRPSNFGLMAQSFAIGLGLFGFGIAVLVGVINLWPIYDFRRREPEIAAKVTLLMRADESELLELYETTFDESFKQFNSPGRVTKAFARWHAKYGTFRSIHQQSYSKRQFNSQNYFQVWYDVKFENESARVYVIFSADGDEQRLSALDIRNPNVIY